MGNYAAREGALLATVNGISAILRVPTQKVMHLITVNFTKELMLRWGCLFQQDDARQSAYQDNVRWNRLSLEPNKAVSSLLT